MKLWDKLYDLCQRHRKFMLICWVAFTALMAGAVIRINLSEDISDFFQSHDQAATALRIHSARSGSDRIIALVEAPDKTDDGLNQAITAAEMLADTLNASFSRLDIPLNLQYAIDLEMIGNTLGEAYETAPQYSGVSAVTRADSIIAHPEELDKKFKDVRRRMAFPGGAVLSRNFTYDPGGIFCDIPARLNIAPGETGNYEVIDGHYFTSDSVFAVVMAKMPYGATESGRNAMTVSLWRKAADNVMDLSPVRIFLTGGPVIAVDNASALKSDSLILISLSALVMLAILAYAFRRPKKIILVLVAITWGWLAAMAVVSLVFGTVSIIVIAMASVVFGIAVNYPLHMLDHLGNASDRQRAFAQIVPPLLTGNITTVAAFLVLVTLEAPAMKTLGLFGAVMLVMTIIFVIIILPLLLPAQPHTHSKMRKTPATLFDRLASFDLFHRPKVLRMIIMALITLVLGYFSLDSRFNPDVRSINYLTPAQLELRARLAAVTPRDGGICIAAGAPSFQEAVDKFHNSGILTVISRHNKRATAADSIHLALPQMALSSSQTKENVDEWNRWRASSGDSLAKLLTTCAANQSIKSEVIEKFTSSLSRPYRPVILDSLRTLVSGPLALNLLSTGDTTRYFVVRADISPALTDSIAGMLTRNCPDLIVYRPDTVMTSLTETLSDNFNYVGAVCGAVVFLFLWLSFRNFRHALIAFMPMVIAWVWILGIMRLAGMEFNMITIILATFIFGQGDDYTIFITEGIISRRTTGADVLHSYKRSILISAVMMFAGMGVLLFAVHPALRSLGEVTLIGMATVVVLAWIIPPLMFRLLYPKD